MLFLSGVARTVTGMTMKRSQFGSLADRLGLPEATPAPAVVRHVWVDAVAPGLVMDRRRDAAGCWEGLVVWVRDGRCCQEWIPGARISTVTADR